jgi:hypothetical protein
MIRVALHSLTRESYGYRIAKGQQVPNFILAECYYLRIRCIGDMA